MLYVVKGDCTEPLMVNNANNIICHITNNIFAWGSGVVMAISNKWPKPEEVYRQQKELVLGKLQLVEVEKDLYVANLTAQSGIGFYHGLAPIRYGSFEECLLRLKHEYMPKLRYKNTVLHLPELGCGRGGGSIDKVKEILNRVFPDLTMYMYLYDGEFK
jgi:O-acetyl-ADP-ribose deacetylase (regulator of RNase III)